jgi:signal transduction histidine kinase
MNAGTHSPPPRKYSFALLRIVLPYAAFSSLYILLSDRILAAWPMEDSLRTELSIYKGWAFVLITALLLAGLLHLEWQAHARDHKALRDSEAKLRLSQQQLRALSARVEALREEERTRISREIHDELGQKLTAIKMDLRWIEHRLDAFESDLRINPILDKLIATVDLTEDTVRSVQRIAAELRPGILDKLGLGMALLFEASQFQKRTGIACHLQMPEEDPPMPARMATAFFRIFQEALTNVARHAHASLVDVSFQLHHPNGHLVIRDNGRGLPDADLAAVPSSLGLLGMQERARLLDGQVTFQSLPSGGTQVHVRIPLNLSPTSP